MPTRRDGRDSSDEVLRPLDISDAEAARRQRLVIQAVLRQVERGRATAEEGRYFLRLLGLCVDDETAPSGLRPSPPPESAPARRSGPKVELCRRGLHEMTVENVRICNGQRACRQCVRDRNARIRAAARERRLADRETA